MASPKDWWETSSRVGTRGIEVSRSPDQGVPIVKRGEVIWKGRDKLRRKIRYDYHNSEYSE